MRKNSKPRMFQENQAICDTPKASTDVAYDVW